jgi:hypothetical protein
VTRYKTLDFSAPIDKKFDWCPVTPMIFQNNPFGENVEGLSYCGNKSCVIESAVQKDDFQYPALC